MNEEINDARKLKWGLLLASMLLLGFGVWMITVEGELSSDSFPFLLIGALLLAAGLWIAWRIRRVAPRPERNKRSRWFMATTAVFVTTAILAGGIIGTQGAEQRPAPVAEATCNRICQLQRQIEAHNRLMQMLAQMYAQQRYINCMVASQLRGGPSPSSC